VEKWQKNKKIPGSLPSLTKLLKTLALTALALVLMGAAVAQW